MSNHIHDRRLRPGSDKFLPLSTLYGSSLKRLSAVNEYKMNDDKIVFSS